MLLRLRCLAFFLSVLSVLVLGPNSVGAQYATALFTISPVQVHVGDSVNFEWFCPSELLSWQFLPFPFIYAQISVNRVQEVPTSIAPYVSPPLPSVGGPLRYTPPTIGTFTAILRCHYLGTPIDRGDFSCAEDTCKSGGQFVVTTT